MVFLKCSISYLIIIHFSIRFIWVIIPINILFSFFSFLQNLPTPAPDYKVSGYPIQLRWWKSIGVHTKQICYHRCPRPSPQQEIKRNWQGFIGARLHWLHTNKLSLFCRKGWRTNRYHQGESISHLAAAITRRSRPSNRRLSSPWIRWAPNSNHWFLFQQKHRSIGFIWQ